MCLDGACFTVVMSNTCSNIWKTVCLYYYFLCVRLDKNSLAMEFISPPSKLPKVTRSKSKSKSSGDIALEASQQSANIEIPVSQHAESKQTREGTEDEPSVISGSDANRENDGNDNDGILSRLPASGFILVHLVEWVC